MSYQFPMTGKWAADYPVVLIDHIDVEGAGAFAGLRFRDFNWYPMPGGNFYRRDDRRAVYPAVRIAGRTVRAHEFLTGTKDADHVDGNPFNCTSANLDAEASRQKQVGNRGMSRNNTSGIMGVSKLRDKWVARVRPCHADGTQYIFHQSIHSEKITAGCARDDAAVEHFGFDAVYPRGLNFPERYDPATGQLRLSILVAA